MTDTREQSIPVLIGKEEIEQKLDELADKLSQEYKGKTLHMICILKGGVFFLTELAKRMSINVTMDYNQ